MTNLDECGDSSSVTVAVPGLQVKKRGRAGRHAAGGLDGQQLGALSTLRIQEPLSDHLLPAGNDTAEVRVRRSEPRRLVGQLRRPPDEAGLENANAAGDGGGAGDGGEHEYAKKIGSFRSPANHRLKSLPLV